MVKTWPSSAGGVSLIPGQETKIPHAMQHGQKGKKINSKFQLPDKREEAREGEIMGIHGT